MTPERLEEIADYTIEDCESTKDYISAVTELDQIRGQLLAELSDVTAERDRWKAVVQSKQYMLCSWCNHRTDRNDRSDEDWQAEVCQHVYSCTQRPEGKLMSALMSIIVPLGIDMDSFAPGDIDGLIGAVDRRWREVLSMIPEPVA